MSHSLRHGLNLGHAPGTDTDVTGNPQLGVGAHLPRQHRQEMSKMSAQKPVNEPREIQFDYDNQAWIINGVYQNCNHPASMARQCEASCYGRMHQGEKAPNIH